MASDWKKHEYLIILVVAGVATGILTAALQKWIGLKIPQKTVGAGVSAQANLGKYQVIY